MATPQTELEERLSKVERIADRIAGEAVSTEVERTVASLQKAIAQLTAFVRSEFEEIFEAELADIEVALVAEAREIDRGGRTHDAREVLSELGVDVPTDD